MATNKRVNVLVYSGPGSTPHSLRQTLYSLRQLLSPHYAVLPLSASAILSEPWPSTCAAICFPGGADLPYCRTLNGAGNRRIKQFVQGGGKYIGFCAGGYYASARCEFMLGDPVMEVAGDRELAFYPDTCRGLAFPGFKYQSEEGARAAELSVRLDAFTGVKGVGPVPESFRGYFNGGGVFVDGEKYKSKGVEILASYTEKLNVDSGDGTAAVVYCKLGDGAALLTGTHPEFAAANLDKHGKGPNFAAVVDELERDDKRRAQFLKACLLKLGLEVNQSDEPVPSLSPLHLSTFYPDELLALLSRWTEIMTKSLSGEVTIKGENDTFQFTNLPSSLQDLKAGSNDTSIVEAISSVKISSDERNAETSSSSDRIVDYDKAVKQLIVHHDGAPSFKETPSFNHAAFYANLRDYQKSRFNQSSFGKYLLFGEVVTSTSTMLEKNHSLLRTLPTGFTATATTQVSGRGRGTNVWVSPLGSLMFSTVIWHPVEISQSSPVVFVQYLAAMAVVRGVKTYGRGYDRLAVRLKWPNDVYAEDPSAPGGSVPKKPAFVKIGGILVNSSYSGASYGLVVGVGVNVANAAPTTGLDVLARRAGLPAFDKEKLLARILTAFEGLYTQFCSDGWGSQLESTYSEMWLHSDQTVTLEAEGGIRAKIKGITRDWGLLLAEELGWEDRPTGKMVTLQSDSNSFDFFRGLVKRKI